MYRAHVHAGMSRPEYTGISRPTNTPQKVCCVKGVARAKCEDLGVLIFVFEEYLICFERAPFKWRRVVGSNPSRASSRRRKFDAGSLLNLAILLNLAMKSFLLNACSLSRVALSQLAGVVS
jgi:hypothetical protein